MAVRPVLVGGRRRLVRVRGLGPVGEAGTGKPGCGGSGESMVYTSGTGAYACTCHEIGRIIAIAEPTASTL